MAGNHSLCGLGSEQDEASVLSGKNHGKSTNDNINLVQDNVHRKFLLEDANKFAKTLKNTDEVFVGFIEATNASWKCHFTRSTVYGEILKTAVNKKSEALLDEMQTCYSNIFYKPNYPITQKCVPFSIPLEDENFPTPKRKMYPLGEPELKELHE